MTLETVGIIIGGLIFASIPFGMLIYCIVKELAEKPKYANLDVNLLVSTVTYSEPSGYISDDSDADFEDKLDNFEEYEKNIMKQKLKAKNLRMINTTHRY